MLLLSVQWRKYNIVDNTSVLIAEAQMYIVVGAEREIEAALRFWQSDNILLTCILLHLEDISFHPNSFHIFSKSVQQD